MALACRPPDYRFANGVIRALNDGRTSNGTKGNKIDYVLCSPQLYARLRNAGIYRMGVWGGKNGTLFPHYNTMQKAQDAASDRAAI